ncbi:MAG: DNA repair protein RadC [Peptoniphilaceae bacterium]|nr:DNA repair protein RadC [Peptoniphilaceae bacterium]MCI6660326.1 DNA repair protein RadC [Peptoniphilaceae bacterium]MDD7433857.1 DNA repair protein RadC [Peptoniphilaceae bacterium]MDY3075166.1 DNA repair protein RadC [Peptoniphilaceae bacterium]MDY3987594.1 DNA repair protein RadC [Peptoniphilaceae bacterium]
MRGYKMKEYPTLERPIEKMVQRGVESLSDEELLAILIGSGTREKNALELAETLLRRDTERTWLLQAKVDDFESISGIGKTKACRILAGLELGKRLMEQRDFRAIQLSDPRTVAHYFSNIYARENRELFCTVLLDTKNRPLRMEVISIGILNQTLVHPREVFRSAVRAGAWGIILSHNHPSGDPEPSPEDIAITKRLVKAGEMIGISVLDHVICGKNQFVSFKERKIF